MVLLKVNITQISLIVPHLMLILNFSAAQGVILEVVSIDERLNEKITSSMAFKKPLLGSYLNVSAKYADDLKTRKKTLFCHLYPIPSLKNRFMSYSLRMKNDQKMPGGKVFRFLFLQCSAYRRYQRSRCQLKRNYLSVKKRIQPDRNILIQHNAGIKHYGKLSYSYKYKGWLNLTQSVNANEVWFDRDKNNNKLVRGSDYKFSSTMSFSVYGIRLLSTPYIRAVRHIITPRVSFTYKPDFSENDKFYSFSSIGLNSTDRQRSISLSLTNLWQLKFGLQKI